MDRIRAFFQECIRALEQRQQQLLNQIQQHKQDLTTEHETVKAAMSLSDNLQQECKTLLQTTCSISLLSQRKHVREQAAEMKKQQQQIQQMIMPTSQEQKGKGRNEETKSRLLNEERVMFVAPLSPANYPEELLKVGKIVTEVKEIKVFY